MQFVEFTIEWNRSCKRLKGSKYDLSKIKIVSEIESKHQKSRGK